MKRFAQVIGLPAENRIEYERYHAAVWPSVLDRLTQSNIHNFSIFRYGELLFSYFEYTGSDYEADMEAMSADPEVERWMSLQMPLQRPLEERAEETAERLQSPLITVETEVHGPAAGYDNACLNEVLLDFFLERKTVTTTTCPGI